MWDDLFYNRKTHLLQNMWQEIHEGRTVRMGDAKMNLEFAKGCTGCEEAYNTWMLSSGRYYFLEVARGINKGKIELHLILRKRDYGAEFDGVHIVTAPKIVGQFGETHGRKNL